MIKNLREWRQLWAYYLEHPEDEANSKKLDAFKFELSTIEEDEAESNNGVPVEESQEELN